MGASTANLEGDYYEFGSLRIEISERALYCGQQPVTLFPKVFDILLVLVEESGRVVTKAELLERVWPGTFVEEGSITQNVSMLRKSLASHFPGENPIATIPRRGYRFTARVRLGNRQAHVVLAEPPAAPAAPALQLLARATS